MIVVHCSRCMKELDAPGALAFSPPGFPFGMVDKYHLCVLCWFEVRPHMLGK